MLKEFTYSVLIVSANDKFTTILTSLLPPEEYSPVTVVRDVGSARRALLETDRDIIIVNTPLPDEMGVNFAIDTGAESNSVVMLCVKEELYDEINSKAEDYGVLTLSKPTSRAAVRQSLKLMCATRKRLMKMQEKTDSFEQKMIDIKTVNRAKLLLIENLGLTENEAHKRIEKMAMDTRSTKRAVADRIISEYTNP